MPDKLHDAPFLVVWRDGGGPPTVKHVCHPTALNEARRLARLCPGTRFFVLAPVTEVLVTDVIETNFKSPFDELPF